VGALTRVIPALQPAGLEPSVVFGTTVGAINAAL
jgi:predicted acylesterase/phospholipase RssA